MSLALVSNCRRCFVVVGSGLSSCGCVCLLLRLVGGGVLSFLSAAASPQSKLTHPFVHKFQQVVATNRKVFKRVLDAYHMFPGQEY